MVIMNRVFDAASFNQGNNQIKHVLTPPTYKLHKVAKKNKRSKEKEANIVKQKYFLYISFDSLMNVACPHPSFVPL